MVIYGGSAFACLYATHAVFQTYRNYWLSYAQVDKHGEMTWFNDLQEYIKYVFLASRSLDKHKHTHTLTGKCTHMHTNTYSTQSNGHSSTGPHKLTHIKWTRPFFPPLMSRCSVSGRKVHNHSAVTHIFYVQSSF